MMLKFARARHSRLFGPLWRLRRLPPVNSDTLLQNWSFPHSPCCARTGVPRPCLGEGRAGRVPIEQRKRKLAKLVRGRHPGIVLNDHYEGESSQRSRPLDPLSIGAVASVPASWLTELRLAQRTKLELLATILLPNSVARPGKGQDTKVCSSQISQTIQDLPGRDRTRSDAGNRISSAVHSTTLPPLREAKSSSGAGRI
jgi:hypothetical protein